MKKAINSTEELSKYINTSFNSKEKGLLDYFFKKKAMQITNNRIIHPTIENIREEIDELEEKYKDITQKINYWKKEKHNAENYHKNLSLTMLFKKNYWRHRLKVLTNKEYKQDVIDSKLNPKILLDPEYQNLFETFLVDPDYREKLKETINNSIVYKNKTIGDYSLKKQEFKKTNAKKIIEQLSKKKIDIEFKKKILYKIREIIRKKH